MKTFKIYKSPEERKLDQANYQLISLNQENALLKATIENLKEENLDLRKGYSKLWSDFCSLNERFAINQLKEKV